MFALVKGFVGMICGMRLNVLCWSAAQGSMQCFAYMVLHRSPRTASSAAAKKVESTITEFNHCRLNLTLAPIALGLGGSCCHWDWVEGILEN